MHFPSISSKCPIRTPRLLSMLALCHSQSISLLLDSIAKDMLLVMWGSKASCSLSLVWVNTLSGCVRGFGAFRIGHFFGCCSVLSLRAERDESQCGVVVPKCSRRRALCFLLFHNHIVSRRAAQLQNRFLFRGLKTGIVDAASLRRPGLLRHSIRPVVLGLHLSRGHRAQVRISVLEWVLSGAREVCGCEASSMIGREFVFAMS